VDEVRRKPSVKSVVLSYLEAAAPEIVDAQMVDGIRRHVDKTLGRDKPVSAAYVLDIVSETRLPIARSLGGLPVDLRGRVHFHDKDAAAASLHEMTAEYEAARSAGDKTRAEDCRRAVRKGKDRLKLVLGRGLASQKHEEKQELLQWFLVWLEAPQLFPNWLALRLKAPGSVREHTAESTEPKLSTRD
jgi:hypothetical protein